MKIAWTDEQLLQICALYDEGRSYRQIAGAMAEATGATVTPGAIGSLINRMDIRPSRACATASPIPEEA